MTQKMPRNELLHERRHKRKAGAHEDRRLVRNRSTKELDEWWKAVEEAAKSAPTLTYETDEGEER